MSRKKSCYVYHKKVYKKVTIKCAAKKRQKESESILCHKNHSHSIVCQKNSRGDLQMSLWFAIENNDTVWYNKYYNILFHNNILNNFSHVFHEK